MIPSGACIDGRFEIEAKVATGGMGAIYRARDGTTGEPVAIKILGNRANVSRFDREAHALASLEHPCIVRYVAHGLMPNGLPYLAMEWLEGEDLGQRLARRGLTPDESVTLVMRIAQALGEAHASGIIHRDITPANIFIVEGDLARAKLIDFGIARGTISSTTLTITGTAIGTPAYMSPEQARGERDVDPRADVFSLGCVLFECLTGRPPFRGIHALAVLAKILFEDAPRASVFEPTLSRGLDDLVARMLAKDKEARPSDGRAVANELAALEHEDGGMPERAGRSLSLTTGERRVVSIVVVGTTQTSATTMTVEELSGALEPVHTVVRSMGAHLELLANGSAVVLLPGSGTAADQAERAASCALALRAAGLDGPMAVATGRAEIGQRLPVGETIESAADLVHEASRSATLPIRLDEVTAALLSDRFQLAREGGGAVLAGRRESDQVRTLLGRPTACVGREAELAMLEAIFAHAALESVARVVLVTAPPGAGKSRLRHELLRRRRDAGDKVEVWTARGDPVGTGSAFALAAQALRRTAGVLEGESLDIRRKKLLDRVARHVAPPDAERVACFLGEMIGAPFSDDHNVVLRSARGDPILMGDQIRQAWEDFVHAECLVHPVLLVLEDLHWGDRPTVTLVDAVLRWLPDQPLMVLALARPEVHALFPNLWEEREMHTIRLAGLSRKASERLVRVGLGDEVPDALVARIVERAGGNAFYLEELARAVAEGRSETPETVIAVVQSRLEALDPDARRILRAASLFGQIFWDGGVAALVGGASTETTLWLEELVRRELLERRPESKFANNRELIFRHAFVRDAAYAMLTDRDRSLGHQLAASWLEGAGESDPVVIAEHLERGDDRSRASAVWLRAAGQALEANDFSSAIERAERAKRCGAEGEALGFACRIQAEAHHCRGDFAESARCAEEALGLAARNSEVWAEAALELAIATQRLGRLESLSAVAHDLLSAVTSAPGEATAAHWRAAGFAAALLLQVGRHELAERILVAVQANPKEVHEDPVMRGLIEHARALRAIQAGHIGEYVERLQGTLLAWSTAGNARRMCVAQHNVAHGLLELGMYDEANDYLTTALGAANRMGLREIVASTKNGLGQVLARRGQWEQGIAAETEAAETFRQSAHRRMEGGSRVRLAVMLAETGDLEGAEREARLGVELFESAPPLRPHALAVLARVLSRAGCVAPALEAAREAMASMEALEGRIEEGEAEVRLALAVALEASADPAGARRAIAVARERLLSRAAGIAKDEWRKSFLERVWVNARTIALADAWLDGRDRPAAVVTSER